MAVLNQNFSMYKGDDIDIVINVTDSTDAALDLTGLNQAQYAIKKYAETVTTPTIEKTLGTGIVITDAAGGIVTITLQPSDTSGIYNGPYYHELRIVDSNNKTSTVMTGTVTMLASDVI